MSIVNGNSNNLKLIPIPFQKKNIKHVKNNSTISSPVSRNIITKLNGNGKCSSGIVTRPGNPIPIKVKMTATSLPTNNKSQSPLGMKLPKKVVKTLKPKHLNPNGRVIIIGDIHGCYDEFEELLEKVKYDKKIDNLILVGDLVNKGPYSYKVLKKVMKLEAHVVRGNHEDAALAAYYDLKNGIAIRDKYQWVKALKNKEIKYLEKLPFAIKIPHYKIIIVHAGLTPDTPLKQQELFALYKMRNIKKINNTWIPLESSTDDLESEGWASKWNGPYHVIFGHDSGRRLQFHKYATGLDSGAVDNDHLTACIMPPVRNIPNANASALRENIGMRIISVKVDNPILIAAQRAKIQKQLEELQNNIVLNTYDYNLSISSENLSSTLFDTTNNDIIQA